MPANVLEIRDSMESTRLLSPNEEKGRKGKWGGRFIKRIFRRDSGKKQSHSKIQQHAESISYFGGGDESIADQYFATLKDTSVSSGIEELDHTTVNLSHSGGSNPYSTDESYEADVRANWRRKSAAKQNSRSAPRVSKTNNGQNDRKHCDVSFSSEPTATSTSLHNAAESFGNTENSFVQLDVPEMKRASSSPNAAERKNVDEEFDGTSIASETGLFDHDNDLPFIFHTRSTTSRVLEDTCPAIESSTIVSDHGMEVVLFDTNITKINLDFADDDNNDDIFMSFKLPTADNFDQNEWRDPFTSDTMKLVFPEITPSNENKASTPERKFSIEFEHGDGEGGNVHINVPPSPAVSLRSETSVTWVSHDDDDADERPMKEIHVPKVDDKSSPIMDDDSINEIAVENIIAESLLTPQSSNNTIFASTPVVDEKQPVSSSAAVFPFLWSSPHNVTSVRSAFTPQSAPAMVPTQPQQQQQYRLSPRRAQSIADTAIFPSVDRTEGPTADSPHFPSSSIQQITPSSAFLKRKSVFMGEDLLSQEAACFAEFLEDHDQSIVWDKPQKVISTSPVTSAKLSPCSASKTSIGHTNLSAAERLLFAMTDSVDHSEADEGEDSDAKYEVAAVSPTESQVVRSVEAAPIMVTSSELNTSPNGMATPISESVDLSFQGTATLHSLATSRTGSTDIFSKSLSDEDADDEEEEELTNNASASYASSCTSYAPSTLQGSLSSGLKHVRSRSSSFGVKPLPYCGVFIREDDEEGTYEEDDLSLPSEDFSVHRGGASGQQYVSSSLLSRGSSSRRSDITTNNDGTPLLDQVRNEFLETVQDLAREGSSVVMNFLRPRP